LLGDFLRSHLRTAWQPYAITIAQISLVLLVVWLPVRATFSYARLIPSLRLYAQLWDERDLFLRQQSSQGARDVIVPSLRRNPALHEIQATFWLEGDLQEIPESWINQAAADYYGLASITGRK
jgi:hypothetical protein